MRVEIRAVRNECLKWWVEKDQKGNHIYSKLTSYAVFSVFQRFFPSFACCRTLASLGCSVLTWTQLFSNEVAYVVYSEVMLLSNTHVGTKLERLVLIDQLEWVHPRLTLYEPEASALFSRVKIELRPWHEATQLKTISEIII